MVHREALAAAKAKEDYLKRHMAGETEQARIDLARLAIVRIYCYILLFYLKLYTTDSAVWS